VGGGGTIHRLEGNEWKPMPGGRSSDLFGVWAAPNGEAFAVGELGTLLHFRNGTWTAVETGTTEDLRAIAGVSANEVYAVGDGGTALRFDGATWTPVATPFGLDLHGVWANGSGFAIAAGVLGHVVRFTGASWVEVPTGVSELLHGVWGLAENDFYVVGDGSTALHWTGLQWKLVPVAPGFEHIFHDIHGTAPDDIDIATEFLGISTLAGAGALHAGGYIYHWDGSAWTPTFQEPIHDVLSVWRADATSGFACGDAASLLMGADASWTRVWDLRDLPTYVRGVYGSAGDNVFVIGDDGTIARYSR
jgi:photosystem II stability/assembly factor-like uncharacterized protein